MEDLRRCWKVPYIVYYCNLFEQKLDLLDLRVDEFEEALIDDCGHERNITVVHLLQKLLKPFVNRSIDLTNFDQYLLQVLKRNNLDFILKSVVKPKLNENENQAKSEDEQNDEQKEQITCTEAKLVLNSWNNLSILTKCDIIYKLCELRLTLNDIEAKLSDYEASELRLEPLGVDSNGSKLWYFGDLRLYEEKKPDKKEKKIQKQQKSKATKSKQKSKAQRTPTVNRVQPKTPTTSGRATRSSMRLRQKEEDEVEEECVVENEVVEEQDGDDTMSEEDDYEEEDIDIERDVDYDEELKKDLKYWTCVCATLDDWVSLNDKYKQSKKKIDQEISELLESQYLTEMPSLFQKAEKERQQRLLAIQPKRQSQRLQSKHTNFSMYSENESDNVHSNDEFSKLPPDEQERLKREQIAKQREERLKQRLLKRESVLHDSSFNDELSQEANSIRSNESKSSDFNIRNYFLMYKVLQKILQCKYAWPFKNAVSEDDAPDYNTIIQTPMDLSTVQLKINNKVYKSRIEFVSDLDLLVQNCLTYNGDDTFYGKLAIKFGNYCKRWLQIFYPREISTSLEEKNRQLMKLIQKTENPNDTLNDSFMDTSNLNDSQNGDLTLGGDLSQHNGGDDSNSMSHTNHNDNSQMTENENNQPIDFSDENYFLNRIKKKRKPNPDKDKYIQEPEYVTKRTSSGRLVKMKISTDFDYQSDQEKEKVGPGRPRKREPVENDDGTQEGIQQKHCKSPTQLVRYMSSSDSNDDDDDEFTGKHKPNKKVQKTTRKYIRKRDEFGNLLPRRPKKTIAELTGPSTPSLSKIFENSHDEDTCKETIRTNVSNTNILRQQSSNLNLPQNSEYSFETYVKKINSTCTVGQALAVADAVKAACQTSPEKTTQITPRLSLKVNPAPSTGSTPKLPLTVPIVNPAIKAALNRINQQQSIVNSNENNKVKIISINNNSSPSGVTSKKLLIINNNSTSTNSVGSVSSVVKPVIVNNGASNLVKIINIKSTSSPIGTTRPIFMINKQSNGVGGGGGAIGGGEVVKIEQVKQSEQNSVKIQENSCVKSSEQNVEMISQQNGDVNS